MARTSNHKLNILPSTHSSSSLPPLTHKNIPIHHNPTIRSPRADLLLDALPIDLALWFTQILRNLHSSQSTKGHAAEARGGGWVLVVEEASEFTCGPKARYRDVVVADDATVEVGFDAAVAGRGGQRENHGRKWEVLT